MNVKAFKNHQELFNINPEAEAFFKKEVYEIALASFIDYEEWKTSPFYGSYISGDIKTDENLLKIYQEIENLDFETENIIFGGDLNVGFISHVFDYQKIFVLGSFSTKLLTNVSGWFYVQGITSIEEVLHFDGNDGGFLKLTLENKVPIVLTGSNNFDANIEAQYFVDPNYNTEDQNEHAKIINERLVSSDRTTFLHPKKYVDVVFSKLPEEQRAEFYDLSVLIQVHFGFCTEGNTAQIIEKLKENL